LRTLITPLSNQTLSVTIAEHNVNSPVAIRLIVQQSYGLGVAAVEEPFGSRLRAPALLAVR
jgi:hypothetical protein